MLRRSPVPMLTILWLVAGCSSSSGPSGPLVARITLDRTTIALAVGEQAQLVATARDASGLPVPGQAIDWSTQDAVTATVNATGLVQGAMPGATTITARIGTVTASAQITVADAAGVELVHSGQSDPFKPTRLYLVGLGGGPSRLLFEPEVLPGYELGQPAISADGERIAFTAFVADLGRSYIFTADIDGAPPRQLTFGGHESQPTWSPDGTRIAYLVRPPGADADIWVMQADGSGAVNLTGDVNTRHQYSPDWSPALGGQDRIAFGERNGNDSHIWSMRPDGSERRPVTTGHGWWDDDPAWSPDGRQIAFQRDGPGTALFDIWVVGADGTAARALVSMSDGQTFPDWSPDGRLISFNSAHADDPADWFVIYSVRPDGSDLVRRTYDPAVASRGVWRPQPR